MQAQMRCQKYIIRAIYKDNQYDDNNNHNNEEYLLCFDLRPIKYTKPVIEAN